MKLNIDNYFTPSTSLNLALDILPMKRRVIPKSRARCPLYNTQRTWLLLLISTSAEGIDML